MAHRGITPPLKKFCIRSNFYTYFEIPEGVYLYSFLSNVLSLFITHITLIYTKLEKFCPQ